MMNQKVAAAGSVAGSIAAAVLASSCCWLPLLLVGLGASGAGFAAAVAPLRPYLTGLTVLLLAGAWYVTLRKAPARSADTCAAEGACCPPRRGRPVLLLSLATVFAVGMLAFPSLAAVISDSRPRPRIQSASGPVSTTTLAVQGMTCEACEGHLREALLGVPGVSGAEVDYKTSSARVTAAEGKVPVSDLVQAVRKLGYTATPAGQAVKGGQ